MKVYIAGKYELRGELLKVAGEIRDLGHSVESSWLWNADDDLDWRVEAQKDIVDLMNCDLLVYDNEHAALKGTYWEVGFVAGLDQGVGKLQIHRIGAEQMIFDHLANWSHGSWEEFLTWLQRRPS